MRQAATRVPDDESGASFESGSSRTGVSVEADSGPSQELNEILGRWGLALGRVRDDLALAGSPQRSVARYGVEDRDGGLWVLERVPRARSLVKERIAETLAFLRDRGLQPAHPYAVLPGGGHLLSWNERIWMLAGYVRGAPLERPGYVHEAWRGEALAQFLVELRGCAAHLPAFPGSEPFDLRRFLRHLTTRLRANEPWVLERVGGALAVLNERLLPRLGEWPTAFAHGDVHALNVIWGADHIAAVIDWEFSGYKPEGYDLAVLLGCVGMEQPCGLAAGLVQGLLRQLHAAGYVSQDTWALLPELVLATRFMWLSEWLRAHDREMVDLELAYIALVLRELEALRTTWGPSQA